MAIFGRESAAEQARVERCRLWVQARSPFALLSFLFGVLSVLDFFTLVLGVPMAIAAIVLGIRGRREVQRDPALLGRRLAVAGVVLGCIGLLLSTVFLLRFVLFPPK